MNDRATELSLQQLRTFRDVYELGGYAAAARKSLLSVPTIWQHIQSLEKQYGVRLFEKVGRRVEPTTAATRLYGAVDELLVDSNRPSIWSPTSNRHPTPLHSSAASA